MRNIILFAVVIMSAHDFTIWKCLRKIGVEKVLLGYDELAIKMVSSIIFLSFFIKWDSSKILFLWSHHYKNCVNKTPHPGKFHDKTVSLILERIRIDEFEFILEFQERCNGIFYKTTKNILILVIFSQRKIAH